MYIWLVFIKLQSTCYSSLKVICFSMLADVSGMIPISQTWLTVLQPVSQLHSFHTALFSIHVFLSYCNQYSVAVLPRFLKIHGMYFFNVCVFIGNLKKLLIVNTNTSVLIRFYFGLQTEHFLTFRFFFKVENLILPVFAFLEIELRVIIDQNYLFSSVCTDAFAVYLFDIR